MNKLTNNFSCRPNKDRFLKGLECCIKGREDEYCPDDCPYYNLEKDGCGNLLKDCLSYIQAMDGKARIMTVHEVITLPFGTDVWVQLKDYSSHYFYPVIAANYDGHGSCLNFVRFSHPVSEYGKTYVCWNKRPTLKQIKEVKWE